jgi:hypothetical protein
MTSFVYKTPNRPEAAPGANDDEVMAFGIALVLDEMVPGGEWEAPDELREDGLSMRLFDQSMTPRELEVERLCLATIAKTKQSVVAGEVI